MSEEGATAEADVRERRLSRRVSAVWLFPIVALVVAGGLAYRTLSQLGPEVVVLVDTASGISVDKTTVRYRDMELGSVESIEFTEDLSQVRVKARLSTEARPFLTSSARFWVAKPRVSLSGISGLETLVSGSYIAFEPGKTDDASQREFEALSVPPISVAPGRRFILEADERGYIQAGDGVYYRGKRVGTVLDDAIRPDARSVGIAITIDEPFDRLVRTNTIFWNVSGVRTHLGWGGLDIETPTLGAALAGAVSFATPDEPEDLAKSGSVFRLRDDYDDKWVKWKPKIWLGDGYAAERDKEIEEVVEKPSEALFHYRGEEAGDADDPASHHHWFKDLYASILDRLD